MADDGISARTMAQAARFDPQFAVPVRPRVRRGLVARRYGDRLVVDGTPTRHVLRGAAATDLVPRLLPLLDGARDHDHIAAALGTDSATVFAALSLLWTCGVVEEAAPDGTGVTWVPDHLADYLSRIGDATAANPAWEQSAARLADARVAIHGDATLAAALHAELGATLPATTRTGTDTATLVVLAITGEMPAHAATLVDRCWRDGIPLLRIALRGSTVELGPYVHKGLGPCLECLTADEEPAGTSDDGNGNGTSAADPDTDDPTPVADDPPAVDPDTDDVTLAADDPTPVAEPDTDDPTPTVDPDTDDLTLAAGLGAAELVGLVGRATRVPLPVRWRRIDLDRMAETQRAGATRPGCRSCSALPAGTPRPPADAARYEAAVALPPRQYADAKAHQVHYKPANVALQRGHRTWPAAPRLALPAPKYDRLAGTPPTDRLAGTPPTGRGTGTPPAAGIVDLDALSLLLAVGAGWRAEEPDRVWRWTASGGNIGSVVAHVVARRVDGLPAGLYGYVPAAHELALLRADDDPCPDAAPASLLLTADLGRVAYKYGPFGLRVVLLDAGCAQTTILAAGDSLELPCRCAPHWDDERIAAAVGTDPDSEPVTALLHLGGRR